MLAVTISGTITIPLLLWREGRDGFYLMIVSLESGGKCRNPNVKYYSSNLKQKHWTDEKI